MKTMYTEIKELRRISKIISGKIIICKYYDYLSLISRDDNGLEKHTKLSDLIGVELNPLNFDLVLTNFGNYGNNPEIHRNILEIKDYSYSITDKVTENNNNLIKIKLSVINDRIDLYFDRKFLMSLKLTSFDVNGKLIAAHMAESLMISVAMEKLLVTYRDTLANEVSNNLEVLKSSILKVMK